MAIPIRIVKTNKALRDPTAVKSACDPPLPNWLAPIIVETIDKLLNRVQNGIAIRLLLVF